MVREYTITFKEKKGDGYPDDEYFNNKKNMMEYLNDNGITLERANESIAQIFYKDYKNGEETWVEVLFDMDMDINLIDFKKGNYKRRTPIAMGVDGKDKDEIMNNLKSKGYNDLKATKNKDGWYDISYGSHSNKK